MNMVHRIVMFKLFYIFLQSNEQCSFKVRCICELYKRARIYTKDIDILGG